MKHATEHKRLDYLDWLRVFAVLLLVPFHTGMIFVFGDFHIKNGVSSTGLTIVNRFIDNWHMPLLFLLSGASTWFALKKRTRAEYIKERFLRLIIPLAFGMFVIVPPQTYFERLQKSGFQGSYGAFYGQLFNGVYPEGNLTWNHLWFLLYLFLISMGVLPLILKWKSNCGAAWIQRLGTWLAGGRRIFLLCLPLVFIQMSLKVAFPGPQNLVNDLARIFFMLCIFLYGVLFFLVPGFNQALERNFKAALFAGLAVLCLLVGLHFADYHFVFGYNPPNLLQLGIRAMATLCWLIVFLALARKTLNFSNRFLKYANEAVLPFYILHQTVIIFIGYYLVQPHLSLMVKYLLINLFAFIITLALYAAVVKPIPLLRFLFGMRPKPKKAA